MEAGGELAFDIDSSPAKEKDLNLSVGHFILNLQFHFSPQLRLANFLRVKDEKSVKDKLTFSPVDNSLNLLQFIFK